MDLSNKIVKTELIDRSKFGPGPWDDEPDRILWTDAVTGYPCLMKRGPMGAWCGYVGIPPGHPAHGKPYSELDVDTHGGLTYGAECDGDPETGICHPSAEGDHVYWLGFDCSHSCDVVPRLDFRMLSFLEAAYRDADYVERIVAALALDLAALKGEQDAGA